MNILFLQDQPCSRALKYAKGLKGTNKYRIVFGYNWRTFSESLGEGDELVDKWIKFDFENREKELADIIFSEPFDIIHCHNAPNFISASAIKIIRSSGNRLPVIHDTHDLVFARIIPYSQSSDYSKQQDIKAEQYSNLFADGRIYSTKEQKDMAVKKFHLRSNLSFVFNSYVNKDMIPFRSFSKESSKDKSIHIVYEGTLSERGDGHHYDLRNIFKQLSEKNIHVHIYTRKKADGYLALDNSRIHFHGHVMPNKLIQEMTRYDFGWAGFNLEKNSKHLDIVLPNKVMEYVAAGLPVLSFPTKAIAEFLEENKLGLVIESVQDLNVDKLKKARDGLTKNALEKRSLFTIENEIKSLENFYQEVINKVHGD